MVKIVSLIDKYSFCSFLIAYISMRITPIAIECWDPLGVCPWASFSTLNMDCIYHNGGDKNFQSLGQFSIIQDLRAQPILVRMSCNVGKCKLHGSTTYACKRRS